MVLISASLIDVLTLWNKKVTAMAFWPFIIFRSREDASNPIILNHERIHHRQQLEMLIVPYYVLYFAEYWTKMFQNGFNHEKAYFSVSFEREAYDNEKNFNYLRGRRFLASLRYFRNKNKQ